jgi:hypothetical protein
VKQDLQDEQLKMTRSTPKLLLAEKKNSPLQIAFTFLSSNSVEV